jgi:hypothetical protein
MSQAVHSITPVQTALPSGRHLARADAGRLALLLLLASLIHVWLIARTEVLARDGTGFVRYALQLERRPWREVVSASHQHPLYPLTVLAASLPVRHQWGTTPETMRLSAQLAAAAAGVLLVIPMYFLGQSLFDRRAAFWAAALFQCLPVTARILADALSDAQCLLLVVTALWLGTQALRTGSVWHFAACGLFGGLAYLTRPEGILPAVAVGVVWLAMQTTTAWRRPWRQVAAGAAGLAVAALVVVGPFVAVTGRLSTKPTAQGLLRAGALVSAQPPATTASVAPLPTAAPPRPDSPGRSLGRGLWALASTTARDFQWLGALPALVGLWWFCERWRRQPEAWVLLLLCGLLGAVLVRMSMVVGYLGERHAQLLVLCGTYWAVAAVAALGDGLAARWGRRWVATALLVGLTGFGLPVLAKPLHANQAGYRTAGLWLAAHARPGDEIIDGHGSASYYAGRILPDETVPGSVSYVVVEEPPRTPLPAEAQSRVDEVIRQGTVVFHCPAEAGRGKGQEVVVYASRPASPGAPAPTASADQ